MSERRLTRRSLLAASAGAVAGGMARPGGVLAALAGPPRPRLEERWLGRLAPGATTIALTRVADLVGVQWRAPSGAQIELRFRGRGGAWSGWVSAGMHGHGPEAPSSTPASIGDPVWTGGTTTVQLRAKGAVSGVCVHLVDVSGGVGASRRAASMGGLASSAAALPLPLATPALQAGAGQPPIIARRAWAQGMAPPRVAPEYGAVHLAFVHHTENPNGYAPGEVPSMLLAIYVFHRYVRGWNDIGYNFVLDLYGRIFEARAGGIDEPVVGAQAGGYNAVSTGVAVLGSFMSVPISAPARSALERLLAWKLSLHGVPSLGRVAVRVNPAGAFFSRFPANHLVSLPRIAGHRDADATDCPGNVLYGELPSIRTGVRRLASRPARATLALTLAPAPSAQSTPEPSPGEPAGSPGEPAGSPGEPAREVQTLLGTLRFLDGTPIAGAPILVQARSVSRRGEVVNERTIAEATTDVQGQWSLPATVATGPSGGMWLRALWTSASGLGAAVSDPLRVSIKAPPAPLAPPAAFAPSAPAASPPAT